MCGVSARFRLQIGMIPRSEQSLGAPQAPIGLDGPVMVPCTSLELATKLVFCLAAF